MLSTRHNIFRNTLTSETVVLAREFSAFLKLASYCKPSSDRLSGLLKSTAYMKKASVKFKGDALLPVVPVYEAKVSYTRADGGVSYIKLNSYWVFVLILGMKAEKLYIDGGTSGVEGRVGKTNVKATLPTGYLVPILATAPSIPKASVEGDADLYNEVVSLASSMANVGVENELLARVDSMWNYRDSTPFYIVVDVPRIGYVIAYMGESSISISLYSFTDFDIKRQLNIDVPLAEIQPRRMTVSLSTFLASALGRTFVNNLLEYSSKYLTRFAKVLTMCSGIATVFGDG